MGYEGRNPRRLVLTSLAGVVGALVLLPSLAPATVEEQRARLPPPATCTDPVEGVWMSHKYEAPYDEWMVFTLTMRHVAGQPEQLTGEITAHAWVYAGSRASEPPSCTPGLHHWIVAMTARGRARGPEVEFWGTRWWVQSTFCGPPLQRGMYNLDHFSGTIDPNLQEFQSVNNDGGRSINDPTVFRRVRCLEPASPPHPYVAPPVFHPRRRAGCGR